MAEYIEFELISTNNPKMLPEDYGYTLVPIYGVRKIFEVLPEEKTWIEENIKDKWASWSFTSQDGYSGQTFAFKLEEDAVAFKLRWV